MPLTDKAVQISQAVFFDKRTQSELQRKKSEKPPYKSGYLIFFKPGSFGCKLTENCNIALRSMHMCLEVLTFKMTVKV